MDLNCTVQFETADEQAESTINFSSFNTFDQMMSDLPIYFRMFPGGCFVLTYSLQRGKQPTFIYDQNSFEQMRQDRPSKVLFQQLTEQVAQSLRLSDITLTRSLEIPNPEQNPQRNDVEAHREFTEIDPMFRYVLYFPQARLQQKVKDIQENEKIRKKIIDQENKPEFKRQQDIKKIKHHKKLQSDVGLYKKPLDDITSRETNSYVPLSQKYYQQFSTFDTSSSLESKKVSKKKQENLRNSVLSRHSEKLISLSDKRSETLVNNLIHNLNRKWEEKFEVLENRMEMLKIAYTEQTKLLQSFSEQNSSQPLKMIDLYDDLNMNGKISGLTKKSSCASAADIGIDVEKNKLSEKLAVKKKLATEPKDQSLDEISSDSSEERRKVPTKITTNKYFDNSDQESEEEEEFKSNGLNSGQRAGQRKSQQDIEQKIRFIRNMFPNKANYHQLNEILLKDPNLDIDSIILRAGLLHE